MNWGKAIRIARAARGFTQGELSERAGIDKSYTSMIENGKRVPGIKTLEKIASITGFPVPLLTILASSREEFEGLSDETFAIMGGWCMKAIMGTTL